MLTTNRLYLRDLAESDLATLREIDGDPEVQHYRTDTEIPVERTRAYLQWVTTLHNDPARTHYPFAIVLLGNEQLIGGCFLNVTDRELREAELGYVLNRRYWNQGYVTEAADALIDYGFTTLHLHRVWATCVTENIGSWRVLEKIGMRREGHLHENRWLHNRWWDSFLYAILEREWQAV